ncbi:MAG: hypothetical protein H6908_03960 [Hyphomicrobiales bacterium]|nr:hypothetical protein [Hyphomicrobiales bacterium]
MFSKFTGLNLLLVLLILAELFFSIYAQSNLLINRDVAVHLDVAGKILDDNVLYKDILIVNLPFLYYLKVIPQLVARNTGIDLITVNHINNYLFVFISLYLCARLLKHNPLAKDGLFFFCTIFACSYIFLLLPLYNVNEFGQKEHLIVLFIFPYILFTLLRLEGANAPRTERLLCAFLAALACCIKPHYALCVIYSEAILMLRHRTLRSLFSDTNAVIFITGCVYLLWILFGTPYWQTMGPLLTIYANFTNSAAKNLILPTFGYMLLTGIPTFIYLLPRPAKRRTPGRAGLQYILGLGLISIFIINIQFKGWGYHYIPLRSLMLLLAGITLPLVYRHKSFLMIWVTLFFTSIQLLFLSASIQYNKQHDTQRLFQSSDGLETMIRRYAKDNHTYMLSKDVNLLPLVIHNHLVWRNSFYHMWPIVGLYNLENQGITVPNLPELKIFITQKVVEDLEKLNPSLIFIGTNEAEGELIYDIDYINFFSDNPDFLHIFSQYQKIDRICPVEKNICVYDVYIRNDTLPTKATLPH